MIAVWLICQEKQLKCPFPQVLDMYIIVFASNKFLQDLFEA
jgi:hypothetical protein